MSVNQERITCVEEAITNHNERLSELEKNLKMLNINQGQCFEKRGQFTKEITELRNEWKLAIGCKEDWKIWDHMTKAEKQLNELKEAGSARQTEKKEESPRIKAFKKAGLNVISTNEELTEFFKASGGEKEERSFVATQPKVMDSITPNSKPPEPKCPFCRDGISHPSINAYMIYHDDFDYEPRENDITLRNLYEALVKSYGELQLKYNKLISEFVEDLKGLPYEFGLATEGEIHKLTLKWEDKLK